MATAKKTTARKAPAKKAAAKPKKKAVAKPKKAVARKTAAKKSNDSQLGNSVEQVVNIYLGFVGLGIDTAKDSVELARKGYEQRTKDLEQRGIKLRTAMKKGMDKTAMPTISDMLDDTKEQLQKVQDQVEDVVESVKDKLTISKAA